jgi:hypothetical protein
LPLPGRWEKFCTVGCAVLCAVAASGARAQTSATPATKPTQGTSTGSSPSSANKTSPHKSSRKHKPTRKTATWKKHGQQKIDAQRTQQIQDALIREHYLQGESSGVWNDATEKAMQRYQADNGWQSKSTPDARALIKLGLGPDQGKLLNPDSAMTSSTPHAPAADTGNPKAANPKAANPKAGASPAAPAVAAPASPAADPPPQK